MVISSCKEGDEPFLRGLVPDEYGQIHPNENPKLVKKKLADFDAEIEGMTAEKKCGLLKALQRCPDLLTDEFKLMFLRSEVFRVKVIFFGVYCLHHAYVDAHVLNFRMLRRDTSNTGTKELRYLVQSWPFYR